MQLASTNLLNAIGATTLQSRKIRSELGISTNDPAVAAPPSVPMAPSPFNPAPAVEDKLPQTFDSPKPDNALASAGVTAVAGGAGAVVYQQPAGAGGYAAPEAVPTAQTYFGVAPGGVDLLSVGFGASHAATSKKFSIAFIPLFIFLVSWYPASGPRKKGSYRVALLVL